MSKIGEISYNSKGEKMTIVEYRNSQDIDIMFDDGTIVKNKRYWNFRKGNVLNPFTPSVYGAGYLGNSSCKENGEYKKAYEVWRKMIERCYSSEYHKRQQTYIGCTVCEEWLCFTTFEKWFNKNYYELPNEKVCLDKDLFFKGNKVYSPQTCTFIPNSINVAISSGGFIKSNDLPKGVSKQKNKYRSQISINGNKKHLGTFNTFEEAYECYCKARKKYLSELAEQYKQYLDFRAYEILIDWKEGL